MGASSSRAAGHPVLRQGSEIVAQDDVPNPILAAVKNLFDCLKKFPDNVTLELICVQAVVLTDRQNSVMQALSAHIGIIQRALLAAQVKGKRSPDDVISKCAYDVVGVLREENLLTSGCLSFLQSLKVQQVQPSTAGSAHDATPVKGGLPRAGDEWEKACAEVGARVQALAQLVDDDQLSPWLNKYMELEGCYLHDPGAAWRQLESLRVSLLSVFPEPLPGPQRVEARVEAPEEQEFAGYLEEFEELTLDDPRLVKEVVEQLAVFKGIKADIDAGQDTFPLTVLNARMSEYLDNLTNGRIVPRGPSTPPTVVPEPLLNQKLSGLACQLKPHVDQHLRSCSGKSGKALAYCDALFIEGLGGPTFLFCSADQFVLSGLLAGMLHAVRQDIQSVSKAFRLADSIFSGLVGAVTGFLPNDPNGFEEMLYSGPLAILEAKLLALSAEPIPLLTATEQQAQTNPSNANTATSQSKKPRLRLP